MYQKQYDSRLGINPPSRWQNRQQRQFRWLPLEDESGNPYPWAVEGKLDKEFHQWLAQRWMKQFNSIDIFRAGADVLSHMINHPEKLEVKWLEYQAFIYAKFENAQSRLQNGLPIPEEEQRELKQHTGALIRSLPDSSALSMMSPPKVDLPPQLQPSSTTEVKQLPPSQAAKVEFDSHQELQQPLEVNLSPKPIEEQIKKIDVVQELSGVTKSMPKPKEPTPKNELEEINIWLSDPILRKEIPSSVLAKFELVLDEQGHPIQAIAYKDADEIQRLEKIENID